MTPDLVSTLQVSAGAGFASDRMELVYWAGVLLAVILAVSILVFIIRKFTRSGRRRGPSVGFDMDSLAELRDRGLLTKEEMARVSEVALRKVSAHDPSGGATVENLALLAQTGLIQPEPAAAPKPIVQAQPTEQAAEPPAQPEQEDADKGISLDALLERGLISRTEYDRLTNRFTAEESDRSPT